MRKAFSRITVLTLLVAGIILYRIYKARVNDIYLVAIPYALKVGFRAPPQKRIVFLQIGGKDPSPLFLAALHVPQTEVRPGSRAQSISTLKSGKLAKDRVTAEKGEYLNFNRIRWNYPIRQTFDPVTGEASIVLERIGPPHTYSDYELSRKNGRWLVIDSAVSTTEQGNKLVTSETA
ncbi:hypothetical protein EON80_15180 [bacterium]|nr:MAG: hypothetical protein EON80_15180 [bacterium]